MAVSQAPPPGRKEPGHVREDVLGELEGGRLVRADGGNHRGSDGFDMIWLGKMVDFSASKVDTWGISP